MKVVFAAEARSRLQSIHGYVAQDSPAHAQQLAERLVRRAEELGDIPHAGREVPEFRNEGLREILVRPYRVIYRIRENVEIITIMHYRQLLPDDLAART